MTRRLFTVAFMLLVLPLVCVASPTYAPQVPSPLAPTFAEVTKVTANDGSMNDLFGSSVGVSGDTMVVGAAEEGAGAVIETGAAYVFRRNQGGADNWGQVKKLAPVDLAFGHRFGASVAVFGDTVVVGTESGESAYVFIRGEGGTDNWGQVKKLTGAVFSGFGVSVAIAGDTIVVGHQSDTVATIDSGSAYIFERNQGGANNWGQAKKVTAGDPASNDSFGFSVAISPEGDRVAVGARFDDDGASDSGSAYVFDRNQGGIDNWGQVKKLANGDPEQDDRFGRSVAVSGPTVVVGVRHDDDVCPADPFCDSGSAYVFGRDEGGPGNWGQVKKLTASDAGQDDQFGQSVAVSGDTVLVGAHHFDFDVVEVDDGGVYVFGRNEGGSEQWGQAQQLIANDVAAREFGFSVSISGNTLAGGARATSSGTGSAYVFEAPPATGIYVLDGYGGLHVGGDAVKPNPEPPYFIHFGLSIATDVELAAGGGMYVLDAYGGVHPAGGAPPLFPPTPYFGFDIARDLELEGTGPLGPNSHDGSGFYVLDGFGTVHAGGGAPVLSPATPYFGFDIAADLELAGSGYYVLDSFGGVHPGGGAAPISPGTPYFGFDIAKDMELASSGIYLLDGFGGVHAGGGAPVLSPATPYFGFDIAEDMELADLGYYVLDGFGGVHPGGGAPVIAPATVYFGFDIAKDIEVR